LVQVEARRRAGTGLANSLPRYTVSSDAAEERMSYCDGDNPSVGEQRRPGWGIWFGAGLACSALLAWLGRLVV
jgi:hypothetical protein